jgi:hypothetical protein
MVKHWTSFVYHTEEGRWMEPENCESIPRVWHTSTYLPDMNLIVTFGGERSVEGSLEVGLELLHLSFHVHLSSLSFFFFFFFSLFYIFFNVQFLDDIMVLDTEIFLWYPPAVSGKSPSPRAGHSAGLIMRGQESSEDLTPELVVFGGTRGRKWESSLHVLNCHRYFHT